MQGHGIIKKRKDLKTYKKLNLLFLGRVERVSQEVRAVSSMIVQFWNRTEWRFPMHRLGAPYMATWRGYLGEGGVWKTDAACINLPGHGSSSAFSTILCLNKH